MSDPHWQPDEQERSSPTTHRPWFNLQFDTHFLSQINDKQVTQDRCEVRTPLQNFPSTIGGREKCL